MKFCRGVLFTALSVLLGAALLAPVLYGLGQLVATVPFHRCVNRALLVLALLAGLGLMRFVPLRWREVGLTWTARSRFDLLAGLAVGTICVAGLIVVSGAWSWNLSKLAVGVLAAVLVAPLEEWLFRGVLQTLWVRRWGVIPGLLISATFFAAVHFLKVPTEFRPEPVTWWSGYEALRQTFMAWPAALLQPKFMVLWLLGLALGTAFYKTGQLWFPIGLHAAIIVMVKVLPLGVVSDYLTMLVLLVLVLGLWRWSPPPSASVGIGRT